MLSSGHTLVTFRDIRIGRLRHLPFLQGQGKEKPEERFFFSWHAVPVRQK